MAQNIYDEPGFFAAYSQLARSREGLAGAPEWDSMRALLPPMAGRSVVDLGCGFGWFCRWAAEAGARDVLGLDVSENMLERARAASSAAIDYRRADLNDPELAPGAFNLAYSSLALHYIEDLPRLLASVHAALRPGGRLVASVEHPMFTAPRHPGWSNTPDGGRCWPVDSYLLEGPRITDWLAPGVVKQHRTIATYLGLLMRSGFRLAHLEEWGPSETQLADRPSLADEQQRPTFLILAADRP
ncbi:MAG TPA: class I SAM-dependent methyltransferase [Phenylobacterium sp.]